MQSYPAALLALASGMTGIHVTDAAAPDADADSHPAIVSVADIRERRVPLDWYEAVAIVAGLCSALVESQATTMPTPGEVILAQDGTIVVRYPSRNADWVGLPRLLHKLLAGASRQSALRLFVLNAISSDGDKSPAAFGAALAYYERPGRDAIVRAVRERFFVTPIPPPGSEPDDVDEPELAPAPAVPPPTRSRTRRVLAVALVTTAAAAAITLVAGQTSGSTSADRLNAVADIIGDAAETGREVARGIGTVLTSSFGSSGGARETAAAVPDTAPPRETARTIRRAIAASSPPPPVAIEPSAAPEPPEHPVDPQPPVEDAVDVEPPLAIADGHHGEVIPPRLLDPVRLPGWAAPLTGASADVIELDVSESGAVERVRLVSPAMRMTDMMILSAAKTWIFEPASRNGQPIPYRVTLKWVSPNP